MICGQALICLRCEDSAIGNETAKHRLPGRGDFPNFRLIRRSIIRTLIHWWSMIRICHWRFLLQESLSRSIFDEKLSFIAVLVRLISPAFKSFTRIIDNRCVLLPIYWAALSPCLSRITVIIGLKFNGNAYSTIFCPFLYYQPEKAKPGYLLLVKIDVRVSLKLKKNKKTRNELIRAALGLLSKAVCFDLHGYQRQWMYLRNYKYDAMLPARSSGETTVA